MVKDEHALIEKARALEGLSFRQLAQKLNTFIPAKAAERKGWTGQAIETYLGVEASTQAGPDFPSLGIELKTIPLNQQGKSAESTFVTTISLTHLHEETWETSACFAKLRRVLWVPVEGNPKVDFVNRRVGKAILWSPNDDELEVLKQDWLELTSLIILGRLHELNARLGSYLQVRPKAANSKSLRQAYDEEGCLQLTLPRGFYLRAGFTTRILAQIGQL